jgi:hypothetical protein
MTCLPAPKAKKKQLNDLFNFNPVATSDVTIYSRYSKGSLAHVEDEVHTHGIRHLREQAVHLSQDLVPSVQVVPAS